MSNQKQYDKMNDLWCLKQLQAYLASLPNNVDRGNQMINNTFMACSLGILFSFLGGILNVYSVVVFDGQLSTAKVVIITFLTTSFMLFAYFNGVDKRKYHAIKTRQKEKMEQLREKMSLHLKPFLDFEADNCSIANEVDRLERNLKQQLSQDKEFLHAMLMDIQDDTFIFGDRLKNWIFSKSNQLEKSTQQKERALRHLKKFNTIDFRTMEKQKTKLTIQENND